MERVDGMEVDEIDSGEALARWLKERPSRPRTGAKLGQILRAACLIDRERLDAALAIQRRDRRRRLGGILLECGALSARQLDSALAVQCGIPRIRPDAVPIAPETLALLPAELAMRHRVMPVLRSGSMLFVAMENPFDAGLVDLLRFNTALTIAPMLAGGEDIALAHARHYSPLEEEGDAASAAVEETAAPYDVAGVAPDDEADGRAAASRRPIVRLFDAILHEAVLRRASDINIRPEGAHVGVHYRIDGRMRRVRTLRRSLLAALVSRIKIVGRMNIAERRLAQQGGACLRYQDRPVDLRFSVIPTVEGESVVVRVLDRERGLKPLAALGLPDGDERCLRRLLDAPHGLLLVTGPTGAGKSTTLYALLNELRAAGERHILTVEDPVEYRMQGIEQVQVAESIGYGFAEVLRRFLRHDPDVIMVGEIRDRETAAIACRAALTGHFVLSSLHTNDAPGAVTRLLDMGVEPAVIAATLRGVMAQRLVRLRCTRCDAAGCAFCGGSGHAGRRLVCEVLEAGPSIAALIERGAPLRELVAAACEGGMMRLSAHAMALADAGLISREEALVLDGGD
jgi:type IV pilus assembly protein PilB